MELITKIGGVINIITNDGDRYPAKIVKLRNGGRILFVKRTDLPESHICQEIFTWRDTKDYPDPKYIRKGERGNGDYLDEYISV